MEVLGLEHIDLTVNDLERSAAFYETVLTALGFRRFSHPSEMISWSNGKLSITLRPSSSQARDTAFDRYRVGLHHLAFKARSRSEIDALHDLLVREGLPVLDPPAEYPQYGAAYYAVFFADPDGIKLEYVHFPWGYWRRVQTDGHDERPRAARR